MSIQDRAKQFMPFSALAGFKEALEQVERQYESPKRRKLSENERQQLDLRLQQLQKNDRVTITHYQQDRLVVSCDRFVKIVEDQTAIQLSQQRIFIEDILNLEREEL